MAQRATTVALLGAILFSSFLAALATEVGCSSSSSSQTTIGPAPPGTLACTDAQNACRCAAAATKSGACSPDTLGGPAHCCASLDRNGATTYCSCESSKVLCKNDTTGGSCRCATNNPLEGDTVPTCSAPAGGHCCRARGASTCTCSPSGCLGNDVEVSSCSPDDTIAPCSSPAFEVTACQ